MAQAFDSAEMTALRARADGGDAAAFFKLGAMAEAGEGQPVDPAAALEFYLKSAQLGYGPAQFNVGNLYSNGIGVKQDLMEAAVWLRQAADQGLPEAQYNLALAYEIGRGVAQDDTQAVKWYEASSGKGYPPASYNLGLMAEDGRGMARNDVFAAGVYRKAAEKNFGPAQNNLGIMIAEGRGGLRPDQAEAYAWLSLAVENGVKPTARDIILHRLSEVQMAVARVKVVTLRNQLGLHVAAVVSAAPTTPAFVPITAPVVAPLATDRIGQLEAEVTTARSANTQLLEGARRLTLEKSALEQQLAAQTAAAFSADLNVQLVACQKTIRDLTEKNLQLKAAMDAPAAATLASTSADGDPVKLKQALTSAELRLLSLTEDNKRLNDEAKRSIFEMGSLRYEMDVLRQSSGGKAFVSSDNDALKRIADLQSENARLSTGLQEARAAFARSQASSAQNADLEKRLDETFSERAKVRGQFASLNIPGADNAQADTLAKQVGQTRAGAADFKAPVWRFETNASLLSRQEQLATENARLAASARSQGENVAAIRAQLATAELNLADARKQLEATTSSVKHAAFEKSAFQETIDRLTSDNKRLKGTSSFKTSGEVERLSKQVADLQNALVTAKTAMLAEQARASQATDQTAAAAKAIAANQQTIEGMNAKVAELGAARQQSDTQKNALQEAIDRLTSENKRSADGFGLSKPDTQKLSDQIAELKSSLAVATLQEQASQSKAGQLAAQLAAADKKLLEASGQAASEESFLKSLIDELTRENKRFKEMASQPSADVVRLTAQLAAAEKKLAEISGQAAADKSTLQRLNDQLTDNNQRLTKDTAQSKVSFEQIGTQAAGYKNAVDAATAEQQAQKTRADQLAGQLDSSNKESDARQEAITQLNAELDLITGENHRLTGESVQSRTTVELLNKQVADLKGSVAAAASRQQSQEARAAQFAAKIDQLNLKIAKARQNASANAARPPSAKSGL